MKKCKQKNCKAVNGYNHSLECIKTHDDIYKEFNTPGNRNPHARIRGYKNESLDLNATEDEKLAWKEGKEARVVIYYEQIQQKEVFWYI